ncbi:hypothetical protein ACU635_34525 [[Actinomadura] parvosata]|uniref:hypothetical protein n=1 Tax=[Actinomadura] parvosata TaxID=1955412 RepID=UPI00406CDB87
MTMRSARATPLRTTRPYAPSRAAKPSPPPGGPANAALAAYHRTLAQQRDPATVLRTLLHDHHVRALGVNPEFEKITGRLARAAALRCLALAGALGSGQHRTW